MMKGRQEINQMKFDICQEVMQFDSVCHICFACLHASFTSQRPSGACGRDVDRETLSRRTYCEFTTKA